MGAPRRNNRSDQAGFTLIEVIVAMAVFMITVLGLVAMQSASVSAARQGKTHTQAVNIARFFLTQLQNEVSVWAENPNEIGQPFVV